MPVVNPLARELVFKVVYYGPGLGGKTTSLQYIHATAKPEHRGKMVSLATPVDRTLYFDFLPIRVPSVRGMSVRLQLFTVPGQVYYNATRKLVLTGSDGVVLVFDSQRARADANQESLENLVENLRAHGRDLGEVPHVLQYNKRDLFDVGSIEELDRQLNHHRAPSFATTAPSGAGIYESLEAITRAVLDDFERRMPDTRGLPAASLELPEGGLVDALRRADDGTTALPAPAAASTSGSGEYRLSRFPELDAGEAAARALASQSEEAAPRRRTRPIPGAPDDNRRPIPPPPDPAPPEVTRPSAQAIPEPGGAGAVSFEPLWPQAERPTVRDLEAAFAAANYGKVIALSEQLVARSLAGAAAALGGTPDAPRDPLTVVLVLNIDRRRYLEYRALVRDARSGRTMSATEALVAYAMAIDSRLSRLSLTG